MMTQAQRADKRNEIMDRIAAVKGTTRQGLDERARNVAQKAVQSFTGRTFNGLIDHAYTIWERPENSGTDWVIVKDELRRLYG